MTSLYCRTSRIRGSSPRQLGLILPYKGEVNLTIYDLTGRVVYKSSRQLEKGYNGWNMNRSELPGSGVYYYQVDFETNSKTNKMVVVD
ncbi:MAG: T9SS type A sorting domain-containing protein [Saprospiraceae bacterium]